MTPRDFCYWLKGFMDLTEPGEYLDVDQVATLRQHLEKVFREEGGGEGEQKNCWVPPRLPDPDSLRITSIHDGQLIC